jgi:hypothetical protein
MDLWADIGIHRVIRVSIDTIRGGNLRIRIIYLNPEKGCLPFETKSGLHIQESKMLEDLFDNFLLLNKPEGIYFPLPFGRVKGAISVFFVRRRIPTEEGSLEIGLSSVAGCLRNWCEYRLVR